MGRGSILLEGRGLAFAGQIHYPNFQIFEDEVTFLVGESGTGKSTLLRLLNATRNPSEGLVFYRGKNILEEEAVFLRRRLLLVSQSVYLFDTGIRQNYRAFYEYRELPPPSERVMEEFLSLCCAPFSLDRDCTTLSGGERQRVYLAIHLSLLPEVLLLDEPTSALDPISTLKIEDLMEELKSRYTVIIVTHNMQQAARIADKTAFFLLGEIVEYDDTLVMFNKPSDKRTEEYITGRFG